MAKINFGGVTEEVVTREEFDAQAAVLAQTRTKLDQMEIQLQELAKQLQTPPG